MNFRTFNKNRILPKCVYSKVAFFKIWYGHLSYLEIVLLSWQLWHVVNICSCSKIFLTMNSFIWTSKTQFTSFKNSILTFKPFNTKKNAMLKNLKKSSIFHCHICFVILLSPGKSLLTVPSCLFVYQRLKKRSHIDLNRFLIAHLGWDIPNLYI